MSSLTKANSSYLLNVAFLPQAKLRMQLDAMMNADYSHLRIFVDSSGLYMFNTHTVHTLMMGSFHHQSFRYFHLQSDKAFIQFEISLAKLFDYLKGVKSKSNTELILFTIQEQQLDTLQVCTMTCEDDNAGSSASTNTPELFQPALVGIDWNCQGVLFNNGKNLPEFPTEHPAGTDETTAQNNCIRLPTVEWRRKLTECTLAMPTILLQLYPQALLLKCTDNQQMIRVDMIPHDPRQDISISTDSTHVSMDRPLSQLFYIAHLFQGGKLYQLASEVEIVFNRDQPLMIVLKTGIAQNTFIYCVNALLR